MQHRRVYPKLPDLEGVTPEALEAFDTYLTAVMAQAGKAAVSSTKAFRGEDYDWLKNQRQYWRNVESAIRWVRGQLRRMRTAKKRQEKPSDGDSSGNT